MADLLFVRKDGKIVKLEGDDAIHTFVEQERQTFRETKIELVITRIGLLEPDPRIRDRIMARLFLTRFYRERFDWLSRMSDGFYENLVTDNRDRISYRLFPTDPYFDKNWEDVKGLAFGGAFLTTELHVSNATSGTFTYFQEDWVKPDDYKFGG